jgi:DNA invertase Pin-like site-specific DNA recombinase
VAEKLDKQKQIKDAFENRVDVEYIPPKAKQQEGEDEHRILRVAPYCRVSTDTENQRASYETQIQAYKEYVQKHPDWILVDIYADEGISGTSLKNRDDFVRMIEDCKAGKIDMIITKNISRFARNVVDCVVTARMLKALTPPVAIFFEDVGINTVTQTGELLLVVLAAIAQGESETKSASVKWGFQKRFEAGLPKISPLYGYIKNGRNLSVNESQAVVVRLIYQMFMDRYSISHICMVLNSQSVPSPKGVSWTYSTVRNILSNEKYCGDVIMQKTVTVDLFTHKSVRNDGRAAMYKVRDHHPAIITREDWIEVQDRLLALAEEQYTWDYWLADETEGSSLTGFNLMRLHHKGVGK